MENFWDYSVWGGLNLFSVLLISLLAANLMKKFFPVLKASLIPSSVLGGGMHLVTTHVAIALGASVHPLTRMTPSVSATAMNSKGFAVI